MEDTERPLSLGCDDWFGDLDNCAYNHTLPSVHCPKPGLFVELTILIAGILFPRRRFKVVGSNLEDSGSSADVNTSTILNMVERGDIDISCACFGLNYGRVERLSYVTPFLEDSPRIIYRPLEMHQLSKEVWNMIPLEARSLTYFCIGAGTFLVLMGKLTKAFDVSKDVRRWMKYFSKLLFLSLSIVLVVILGMTSSNIVLFFNQPPKVQQPFRSLDELAAKLETRELKLIVGGQTLMENLYQFSMQPDKRSESARRFMASYHSNPPEFADDIPSIVDLLFQDRTGQQYVAPVTRTGFDTSIRSDPRFCHIAVLNNKVIYPGCMQLTMYLSPKTLGKASRKLTVNQLKAINLEYRRLVGVYFPQKTVCEHHSVKHTLQLSQIQSAFWLLIFATAASIGLLCCEKFHRLFLDLGMREFHRSMDSLIAS